MKILFVIPYFYPAEFFGGPVRVTYDLGKELVKRGHEVVVYTSDAKDLKNRLPSGCHNLDGMKVHYSRNSSMFLVKKSKLFMTPQLISAMASEIKSFDIIHTHEYATYQNIVVHKLAKKYGVPYIVQAHGSLPKKGRQIRKFVFDLFFGSKILRDASKVIALGKMEERQYLSMGSPKSKIALIPNGIDLTEYSDLPSEGSFKKKFGLDKNEKIVLYLGRIHEIKGIDILVRAFANLLHKLDDVRLVIVGPDDGYLAEIEALTKTLHIEERVLVLGPLYGMAKLEAYVDADVYVLPSRYETFPMTVLEAYACGKPVIASKIDGLRDLVVNGETGLLFDLGNIVQLEKSVLSLLDDTGGAEEMGLKGKQFVTENFTIDKVAEKLQNLYRTVASHQHPNLQKP